MSSIKKSPPNELLKYMPPGWYKISGAVVVAFFVASFVSAPYGTIDRTVLEAATILSSFSFLGMLPSIIGSAKSVKLRKGDTTIQIGQESHSYDDFDHPSYGGSYAPSDGYGVGEDSNCIDP